MGPDSFRRRRGCGLRYGTESVGTIRTAAAYKEEPTRQNEDDNLGRTHDADSDIVDGFWVFSGGIDVTECDTGILGWTRDGLKTFGLFLFRTTIANTVTKGNIFLFRDAVSNATCLCPNAMTPRPDNQKGLLSSVVGRRQPQLYRLLKFKNRLCEDVSKHTVSEVNVRIVLTAINKINKLLPTNARKIPISLQR